MKIIWYVKDDEDHQYLLLPGMSWVGEWIVRQRPRQVFKIIMIINMTSNQHAVSFIILTIMIIIMTSYEESSWLTSL